MPCAPAPGGVAAEHRYTPGMPVAYGSSAARGRRTSCRAVLAPGDDVAADVVGVVGLHAGDAPDVAREDALAEAGREALDLALDRLRRVPVVRGGHVGVRVERVG